MPNWLALFHVRDGAVEAELRAAERAGRDVEPPAVEPGHGDLEALAFRADAVCDRHAAVLEHHHRGRLRFPAELLLLRAERQPGRALLDHECRKCRAAPCSPVRAITSVDVRPAAAGNEGLGAVEHIIVAVAPRARLQARGVRPRVRARSGSSSRNAAMRAELRQEALARSVEP